nr:PREDICTED: transmembrane protein 68 [Bemisia tabaci]
MFHYLSAFFYSLKDFLVEYVDIDYSLWLTWVLTPIIITFLLPAVIILLLYMSAIIFFIYKWHRERLKDAYDDNFFHGAIKTVAAVWDAHGWLWHGWEVVGEENIPKDSGALLIYYHGALPIDVYYLLARTYLNQNRLIHTVGDRFLFKIPGWKILTEVLKIIPGTVQSCSAVLKENNMLAISPGGVYEAQFGDCYYHLMWKKRLGFAKVAIDAKTPVIPFFTENIREAFRCLGIGRRLLLRLYLATKIPLVPIYGGFPVKLRTYIGKPIIFEDGVTPEEVQIKVAAAVEELIQKHQRVPGSITRALFDRFYTNPKDKKT